METTEPILEPVGASSLAVLEDLLGRLDLAQLKAVNTIVVSRINHIEAPSRGSRNWRVGDLVEFTHKGKINRATIKSVNLRTASCLPADGAGLGWKVPFSMLRLVGADKPPEVSIPTTAPPVVPAAPDPVMATVSGDPGGDSIPTMLGSW